LLSTVILEDSGWGEDERQGREMKGKGLEWGGIFLLPPRSTEPDYGPARQSTCLLANVYYCSAERCSQKVLRSSLYQPDLLCRVAIRLLETLKLLYIFKAIGSPKNAIAPQ